MKALSQVFEETIRLKEEDQHDYSNSCSLNRRNRGRGFACIAAF
jgi:hypothetical protein